MPAPSSVYLVDPQRRPDELPYSAQATPGTSGCVEVSIMYLAGAVGVFVTLSTLVTIADVVMGSGWSGGEGLLLIVVLSCFSMMFLSLGLMPIFAKRTRRNFQNAVDERRPTVPGMVEVAVITMKSGRPQLTMTYSFMSPTTGKTIKGMLGVGGMSSNRLRPGDGRPAPEPGTPLSILYVNDTMHMPL
ncbi:MAG: hypothetical protein SF162_07840 [bacterium]|nr:hypothetical protein [bacterium]